MSTNSESVLSAAQLSIGPIAASAAVGDMPRLSDALDKGLQAGLAVSDVKEVLVQLYAYAGFPRALNALGAFMKVLEDRQGRDIKDVPGREPGPVPSGAALLQAGTANRTALSGAPVRGPLFDFAPAIDQFLKTQSVRRTSLRATTWTGRAGSLPLSPSCRRSPMSIRSCNRTFASA